MTKFNRPALCSLVKISLERPVLACPSVFDFHVKNSQNNIGNLKMQQKFLLIAAWSFSSRGLCAVMLILRAGRGEE